MKFKSKYEYSREFGNPRHVFSVITAIGGVHLHITDYGDDHKKKYGERYSGGIEGHWRYPINDGPPSQTSCWLLGGPCWHDGSSLQATEKWIPIWISNQENLDHVLELLEEEAREILSGTRLFLGQLAELVAGTE